MLKLDFVSATLCCLNKTALGFGGILPSPNSTSKALNLASIASGDISLNRSQESSSASFASALRTSSWR